MIGWNVQIKHPELVHHNFSSEQFGTTPQSGRCHLSLCIAVLYFFPLETPNQTHPESGGKFNKATCPVALSLTGSIQSGSSAHLIYFPDLPTHTFHRNPSSRRGQILKTKKNFQNPAPSCKGKVLLRSWQTAKIFKSCPNCLPTAPQSSIRVVATQQHRRNEFCGIHPRRCEWFNVSTVRGLLHYQKVKQRMNLTERKSESDRDPPLVGDCWKNELWRKSWVIVLKIKIELRSEI